jgi:hypothetical protein
MRVSVRSTTRQQGDEWQHHTQTAQKRTKDLVDSARTFAKHALSCAHNPVRECDRMMQRRLVQKKEQRCDQQKGEHSLRQFKQRAPVKAAPTAA